MAQRLENGTEVRVIATDHDLPHGAIVRIISVCNNNDGSLSHYHVMDQLDRGYIISPDQIEVFRGVATTTAESLKTRVNELVNQIVNVRADAEKRVEEINKEIEDNNLRHEYIVKTGGVELFDETDYQVWLVRRQLDAARNEAERNDVIRKLINK